MTARTVTAMFATRDEAERAEATLADELHVDRAAIRTSPGAGVTDVGYDKARPYEEKGFFGSLKDMLVPDEDRYGYAEGMRRGGFVLSATVDEAQVRRASDILERAGAADMDAQERSWRQTGWTGYDAAAHDTARGATTGAAQAGTARADEEVIPVVEERLVVGKRVVDHGSVRVRAYVVERPVQEQVTLREERIQVERHPVDRPVTEADMAAFKDRTIAATARSEEAVVSKEARVVEEIGLRKDAAERVETVHDTVRRTEVDVEDTTAKAPAMPPRK